MPSVTTITWNPSDILNVTQNYVLVILNRSIQIQPEYFRQLWTKAKFRLAVDGGANRLLEWTKQTNIQLSPPDYITGDFDSITQKTVHYFQKNAPKTKFIATPDQNATDFTKAVREISRIIDEKQVQMDCIIVIVETCGRLDQIIAGLNTLFLVQSSVPIYLLSSNSLTWLLQPTILHRIRIPESLRKFWCSLIPIKGKCEHTTTTGLKWNLNDDVMEFGGMVSTSNTYGNADYVTVKADNYIVWSMGLIDD